MLYVKSVMEHNDVAGTTHRSVDYALSGNAGYLAESGPGDRWRFAS